MSQYLLISSRDPYDCRETDNFYELAVNLMQSGHDVTLYLVQNGVLPARKSAVSRVFSGLLRRRIKILVDDFSAAERALSPERLKKGLVLSSLEVVIDAMERGAKVVWH